MAQTNISNTVVPVIIQTPNSTNPTTPTSTASSSFIQQVANILLQILPQVRNNLAANQISRIEESPTSVAPTGSGGTTLTEALPVSTASATPATTTDTALPPSAAAVADATRVAAPPVPVVRPIADAETPLVDGEAEASTEATTNLINPTIVQQTTRSDQTAAVAQNSVDPLAAIVAMAE